jgi:hypothetical protein
MSPATTATRRGDVAQRSRSSRMGDSEGCGGLQLGPNPAGTQRNLGALRLPDGSTVDSARPRCRPPQLHDLRGRRGVRGIEQSPGTLDP